MRNDAKEVSLLTSVVAERDIAAILLAIVCPLMKVGCLVKKRLPVRSEDDEYNEDDAAITPAKDLLPVADVLHSGSSCLDDRDVKVKALSTRGAYVTAEQRMVARERMKAMVKVGAWWRMKACIWSYLEWRLVEVYVGGDGLVGESQLF